MKVKILQEEGHKTALLGMAYSFKDRAQDTDEFWRERKARAYAVAPKLAPKGDGHNKFLRQIVLWVDIEAPRCWWSEFDTYKVGTVAQSESTMHTLAKRAPTHEDFEIDTPVEVVDAFRAVWERVGSKNIAVLKCALPEGYLQRRIVTMNYENLRTIIKQRKDHRLHYWSIFIDEIYEQVRHQEYLEDLR